MLSAAGLEAGHIQNQPERIGACQGTGAKGSLKHWLRQRGKRKPLKTKQKGNSGPSKWLVLKGPGCKLGSTRPGALSLEGPPVVVVPVHPPRRDAQVGN